MDKLKEFYEELENYLLYQASDPDWIAEEKVGFKATLRKLEELGKKYGL